MIDRPDKSALDHFESELAGVERRLAAEIDPGLRAMVIAALVVIMVVVTVLPWAGTANGWDVLADSGHSEAIHFAVPGRIFVGLVILSAVTSTLALALRRWGIAWLAAAFTALAAPAGLLAIWTRQTPPPGMDAPGPGIGLILTWAVVLVLLTQWLAVVWRRPSVDTIDGRTPGSPLS
ncbi:Rv2732c family membrane protein [Millisia brevis]|uniref:Rv2732c family membrane protein n=1 Tax=Millisia brevis TaxID=264148 RepID=UPI00082D2DF5|nr:hypothetical protein [Millisia brevis]